MHPVLVPYIDPFILVPRWHKLLKHKFLDDTRNHRLDHLVFVLVCRGELYYKTNKNRREVGLDGPSLEGRRRLKIEVDSRKISLEQVEVSRWQLPFTWIQSNHFRTDSA
jgi:hypothetical protein